MSKPGELWLLPVKPGRVVVLRVLAVHEGWRGLVLTRWEGPREEATRARLRASRKVFERQPATHTGRPRPLLGAWVEGDAPAPFERLGVTALKPDEQHLLIHPQVWLGLSPRRQADAGKVLAVARWSQLETDVRRQWRWDHEREALLKDEADRRARDLEGLKQALDAQAARRRKLEQEGLAGLAGHRFFDAWDGAAPEALVTEAEALMVLALRTLEGRTPARALPVLVALLGEFSHLDEAHGHTFDETEAEDVLEAVNLVAHACGVSQQALDAALGD
jgi:hypothetical protein